MRQGQNKGQNCARTGLRAAILSILAVSLTAMLTACCESPSQPSIAVGKNPKSDLQEGAWRFSVSGDSRNCGDVVMPTIAAHSAQFAPSFYWHLGDLRAIYKIDEDMAFAAAKRGRVLTCESYQRLAWSDFIDNQIAPFGSTPFYLGIGNHEVIPPKGPSEDAFKRQFTDWLDLPVLQQQRQKDQDTSGPQPYYHWIQGGVDFIYLDNASNSFSPAQLTWLEQRLKAAKNDAEIKSVVVGMHEALPDSIANSHSMGDKGDRSPGYVSGQQAYKLLERFYDQSRNPDGKPKPVYVLASHSHFYMDNIFNTKKLTSNGKQPLPGWIIGTAGAVRYALPEERPKTAKTDVYGYLMATVSADSEQIDFSFQQVNESDVPQWVRQRYPDTLVPWCFAHNSQNKDPDAHDLTPRCSP